jgi:predicted amidophosphoribosyltransferase
VLALIRTAIADALALVLPVACAGCGAPDLAVCRTCARALEGQVLLTRRPGGLQVWSAAVYDGPVARLLAAFKDSGATGAAPVLAGGLRRALEAALPHLIGQQATEEGVGPPRDGREHVLLVPVPSAPAATRRRGYLPLAVLARAARLPLTRALRQTRGVRDQAGLTAPERAANMTGAIVADRSVRGREVVLIDDIVTTGSTLDEAARAVAAAGGRVLGAITVAATLPHRGVGASSPHPFGWGQ